MEKRKIVFFNHVLVLGMFVLFSCSKSEKVTPIDPAPPRDTFPQQTAGLTVDAISQPGSNITNYLLYIPDGYNSQTEKWPLVIFLHGVGEIGTNIDVLRNVGLPKVVKGKPFVMVAPQCRANWWNTDALESLYKTVVSRYHIDPNRVYLTGLSMGGMQTWDWAVAHPERFAAIVPIAGRGNVSLVGKIKDLPIWAFHSADDPTVSVSGSRDMVKALQALGSNVKYTEYPNGGHDSWTRAYATADLYTWMLKQKKQ
ncbi:prolyl oligopeptidase family serine peptidase [Chitinophaga sp. HK235]|uniref:carboxylesterase family protein n=1 Tax=Chitinophaga sp. HK235 TaxID=2952571 RepID=UPI001BA8FE9F|nr:prolyl oligopeptidase family serine peptidase [Chitinophaga sp. HK235]